MDHFTLALTTGAVAGALDIIPMIAQKLSFRSCLSAFLQYFFAGPIVFYSNLPYLPWWADGIRDSHDGPTGRADPHGQRP